MRRIKRHPAAFGRRGYAQTQDRRDRHRARGPLPGSATASSHREAPLISQDPSADNTDLYAFRSIDRPDALTVVSNWIPAEDPAAGPMYYEFSPTARYNIHLDRNGD